MKELERPSTAQPRLGDLLLAACSRLSMMTLEPAVGVVNVLSKKAVRSPCSGLSTTGVRYVWGGLGGVIYLLTSHTVASNSLCATQ